MANKLYIFCGIPFSGKSTLSKEVARLTGYTRIDLDEVKFEHYGAVIKDAELEQKDWDIIYQAMYQRIEAALKAGKTVIHDTGNFTKYERDLIRHIADGLGVEAVTVYVDTTRVVAKERHIANQTTHQRFNVTDNELEDAVAEMEVPNETERHIVHKYPTPAEEWINKHFS